MIRGFREKRAQRFFAGEMAREFSSLRKVAERKLTMLDNAEDLKDLVSPTGNRLERLKGDRLGQHSIRINDQWRICFVWMADGPHDVEITDYLKGEPFMTKNGMRLVHPGEILLEEFIKPSDPPISANRLAKALDVPANRITAIINGQRGITGDSAVRLAAFFNTTAEFWMNLQKSYELRLAEQALSDRERKHIAQRRKALALA